MQFNNVILSNIFVANEGQLWTWGQNVYGSLGDGTVASKSSPVQTVAGGATWKQASLGTSSAAIKTDGTLWTWGYNPYGGLGTNDTVDRSSPVQTVSGGTTWQKVAKNSLITAAIKTDGTLWTWGYNVNGNLGDGTTVNKSSPVQIYGGGTNWKDIYICVQTMIGLKTDGTLWTWGRNAKGELGNNDVNLNSVSSPVQTVAAGTNWKSLATGVGNGANGSIAAIKNDGTLYVWGDNTYGQLGVGDTIDRSSPVQTIAGGTNWLQVASGAGFMGAVKTDGTLWTWGWNGQGGLGLNDRTNRSSPVQTVDGRDNWLQISASGAGIGAMAYIPSVGRLYGWGYNPQGPVGDGTTTNRPNPIEISGGGRTWQYISAGYNTRGAIKTDNTLWMWGQNSYGHLGNNSTNDSYTPIQISGTTWNVISVGRDITGAIKTDGTLWMWGFGISGQLGNNDTVHKSSPVQIYGGGTNWASVVAGRRHSAAIKTDGTLWMWGENSVGQLGDNTRTNRSSPTQIYGAGTTWKQVSIDKVNTSSQGNANGAIKTDGTLWVWGDNNYGNLGTGDLSKYSSPVQTIAGGNNWKQVECSSGQAMFGIKTDGTLWSWGRNNSGQLGVGDTNHRSSPTQISGGGTNWSSITGAYFGGVAIKTDGTLWTWGTNNTFIGGSLGNGTTTQTSIPGQVGSLTTWIMASGGGYNGMAIAW